MIYKSGTYLFVRREDCETSARGLVLIRGAKRPEGDRATAKLGEPALQFGLCSVVRQSAHVQDLAALRQESADVCAGIHWLCENVGMILGRLALANKTSKYACKRDSLFHSPAGGCRGECLEVKGKVVLDGRGRLHRLNLERCADVGKRAGTKREALGVVSLPPLVFGAQIESTRVLEVGWEYNGLIARFARQLDAEVPRIECDEGKFKVLGNYVFLCKIGKPFYGISERSSVPDLVPGESGQAS